MTLSATQLATLTEVLNAQSGKARMEKETYLAKLKSVSPYLNQKDGRFTGGVTPETWYDNPEIHAAAREHMIKAKSMNLPTSNPSPTKSHQEAKAAYEKIMSSTGRELLELLTTLNNEVGPIEAGVQIMDGFDSYSITKGVITKFDYNGETSEINEGNVHKNVPGLTALTQNGLFLAKGKDKKDRAMEAGPEM